MNLALAAAALAVVAQSPPAADSGSPDFGHGESFAQLAETLDVASIAPPPPAEAAGATSGIPEPGTWSLLAMGIGVVALFASRGRH
jgi:hypothetical protein